MPEILFETNDLLNFSEASRLLKVTRATIYTMITRGDLHPIKFADRRYLNKEEVEALKKKRKGEPDESNG